MRTLILNAFERKDEFACRILSALNEILSKNGSIPATIDLIGRNINDCRGCFSCWTKTPGECVVNDDAPAITSEMARAEQIIFFSPVVFGGFSTELKRIVERSISLLLPFMCIFHGETHHKIRYSRPYQIYGVGILEKEDKEVTATFRKMVQRLSLNFNAHHYCAGTLVRGNRQNDEQLLDLMQNPSKTGNRNIEKSIDIGVPLLSDHVNIDTLPVKSALMICGSPKGDKGSSWEIGSYCMRQLVTKGVTTRSRSISPHDSLIADIKRADLIILTFPLYTDGIPARFKAALQDIAKADVGRKYCAALVQCGSFESHHNDTAIEMCRIFTRDAGFTWLGGLGRGVGAILEGTSMEQAPKLLAKTCTAIGIAAESLAQGKPIPEEAKDAFRANIMPRWLYVTAADLNFLMQIIKKGTIFSIKHKPYLGSGTNSGPNT